MVDGVNESACFSCLGVDVHPESPVFPCRHPSPNCPSHLCPLNACNHPQLPTITTCKPSLGLQRLFNAIEYFGYKNSLTRKLMCRLIVLLSWKQAFKNGGYIVVCTRRAQRSLFAKCTLSGDIVRRGRRALTDLLVKRPRAAYRVGSPNFHVLECCADGPAVVKGQKKCHW